MNQTASRVPIIIPIVAVLIAWYGIQRIGSLSEEVEQLRGDLYEQASQVSMLETAVGDLESASEDLQSEVGRFEDENWREVVMSVQMAAEEVQGAVEEVQSRLGNLR